MAINTDANAALAGLLSTQPTLPGGPTRLSGPAASQPAAKPALESGAELLALGTILPIASIQGGVVEGLQNSVRDATGKLHALASEDQYAARLKTLLGGAGDPAGLGRSLQQINGAIATLAADPSQPAATVVAALTSFTGKLRASAAGIQELRGQADGALSKAVGQANKILQQIADLNGRVAVNTASGAPTGDAAAQRGDALDALAGSLDFTSFARADGSLSLFTKAGTPLVNGTAATLTFTPAGGPMDAGMSLAAGTLSGVAADGVDITGQLSAGAIHALLQTRDTTLPNAQNQLDTLAQTLQSRVNQVTNRALGQGAARSAYVGSRSFDGSADQRMSLAGGDTMISLVGADGTAQATTSLAMLMTGYQLANGTPTTGAWTPGQLGAALNGWLGRQMGNPDGRYAGLDDQGRLNIQLPAGSTQRLAFRDQRSLAYQSSAVTDPAKALGVHGALTFTDDAGNRMSTASTLPPLNVVPGDSLSAIAAKLNAIGGLSASLAPDARGARLVVTSSNATDLSLEPDSSGATVVAGLGLAPAADQPAEDVAVHFRSGQATGTLTSAAIPSASAPLGLSGTLSIAGSDGSPLAAVAVKPAWDLNTLAAQINSAGGGKDVTASITAVGNQFALRISGQSGQAVRLGGMPGGYQSGTVGKFWAVGGSLIIAAGGAPAGGITVKPGDGLQAIADAVNDPAAPFAAAGIQAAIRNSDGGESLEIGAANGQPLAFAGSALGSGPGQLALRLNPGDALGLMAPADQVVSGLANFLGLNDLFVADPASAFDGKAPTGIFASTATPGTAQALAVSPSFTQDPAAIAGQGMGQPLSDLLNGQMNVAAAGGLPRGSYNLAQYADGIAAAAAANATAVQGQVAYQRVLVESLNNHRAGVAGMDMNDRLTNLMDYQQAYQDSARIISTMPQLLQRLGASAN